MTDQILGPIVSGNEIAPELRRRKIKDIYRTATGSTKKLVAEKVRLEEIDGWRMVRENAKSTRIAKAKSADEQLEDEVWTILAQMGFKELSKGRQFAITFDDDLGPEQVNIFAKDDETAIIIHCAYRNSPGRKNMADLVDKIRAIRERVFKTVRKCYEQQGKLKVRHVIATRNIAWSDADLSKCMDARIAVIADGEIDYYDSLVRHLKQAARYQFLAHMFHGQKIDGLNKQVVATRGKMGGETFYTFLISPDDLLKIAYVGHKASRDIENIETYQRLLQRKRLKKIAEYINEGGRFPTNIVVNLKTTKKSGLRFDESRKVGNEALGILHLPANYASAWIIDGQHRLYGYAYARDTAAFSEDKTTIPVLAYENMPADKEMNLFIDINSKQVKVSTGLLVELYANLHWCSTDVEEAFQALLSRIWRQPPMWCFLWPNSRLNTEKISPLNNRMVVTGRKKTSVRCLTQTSIRDGLEAAKLMGTIRKGTIAPGPLSTEKPNAYVANLKKGFRVLSDCLRMFSDRLADHWKTGDGQGGYLCTNIGIRALFHVMKDIAEHIRTKDGLELCQLTAEDTVSAMSPYLEVLVEYFGSASPREIQTFRGIGSSLIGVKKQSWEMEACIHEKLPDFLPAALHEYLESREVAGTEEAASQINRIHKKLFDYVIGTLKKKHGIEDKAWWTKGIPVRIRKECSSKWEEVNREGEEESQLYLINYVDICLENWDLVKDVISFDSGDKSNKKANTKWIRDLNEIRKITMHPEKGALSAKQVTFVNEVVDKVEKYFPELGEQPYATQSVA